MTFSITFENLHMPLSGYDKEDIRKVLQNLCPEILENPYPNRSSGMRGMYDYNQSSKIKELEETNKGLREKATQDKEKIGELQKEVDSYKSKCEEASQQINAKDEEIRDLKQKHSEDNKTADEEIKKLKDDIENKQQEIERQGSEIDELRRRLSEFIPTFGSGESQEEWYMEIVGDKKTLLRSNNEQDPFKAIVSANGDASFSFNVDKGPHREYCQNTQKLTPFCDIEDQMDGANRIVAGAWGKGHVANDVLTVESKAKVKLVRE